jgi:L-lactate dehydrogenase
MSANSESHSNSSRTKVTVVGAGAVGMACAVSILTCGLCDEMCIIDVVVDKLKGEVMDLQHGATWFHNATIIGRFVDRRCTSFVCLMSCKISCFFVVFYACSDDYAQSAGSSIVVVTAGARQKVGESRRDLAQRNVDIYKSIIPQIAKHSPNAILIVISNPADVMTYVAWKISNFPPNRVFGTGTSLDTSR